MIKVVTKKNFVEFFLSFLLVLPFSFGKYSIVSDFYYFYVTVIFLTISIYAVIKKKSHFLLIQSIFMIIYVYLQFFNENSLRGAYPITKDFIYPNEALKIIFQIVNFFTIISALVALALQKQKSYLFEILSFIPISLFGIYLIISSSAIFYPDTGLDIPFTAITMFFLGSGTFLYKKTNSKEMLVSNFAVANFFAFGYSYFNAIRGFQEIFLTSSNEEFFYFIAGTLVSTWIISGFGYFLTKEKNVFLFLSSGHIFTTFFLSRTLDDSLNEFFRNYFSFVTFIFVTLNIFVFAKLTKSIYKNKFTKIFSNVLTIIGILFILNFIF